MLKFFKKSKSIKPLPERQPLEKQEHILIKENHIPKVKFFEENPTNYNFYEEKGILIRNIKDEFISNRFSKEELSLVVDSFLIELEKADISDLKIKHSYYKSKPEPDSFYKSGMISIEIENKGIIFDFGYVTFRTNSEILMIPSCLITSTKNNGVKFTVGTQKYVKELIRILNYKFAPDNKETIDAVEQLIKDAAKNLC